VEPRAIRVGASSDSDPVFFEVMPAGESGNRRVEIYFEGRG
jgi:flagellar motor protein MotB